MIPNFAEFRFILSCLDLDIVCYTPVKAKKPYLTNWQKNPQSLNYCFEEIKHGLATGYGIVTGNGLIAIDFDGENSFKIAAAASNWITEIDTLSWTSGKPHRQQKLFRIPQHRLNDFAYFTNKKINSYGDIQVVKGEQLEIRYKGSQSVLPPSKHPQTDCYKWIYTDCLHELNDQQCDDLLSIIYPSQSTCTSESQQINTPQSVTNESKDNDMNNYEKYLSELTFPINEAVPLEKCLARKTRELLNGVGEGMRDDTGALIARDLIGTASYLDSIGQRYDGNPFDLLADYCQKCSPSLSIKDCERIFNSAKKSNPKPTLDVEKINNNIGAWYWNFANFKEIYQDKNSTKDKYRQSDNLTRTSEKRAKVEKLDNIAETREILVNDYSHRLRFNELKRIVELDNEEAFLDDLYLKIHEDYGVKVSKQIAYDLAVMIAKKNSYHPVKVYLDNLEAVDREIDIKSLSSLFFGTTDKIYDEMVYRHLIGSVARVYKAGCKFDTALILQGSQGIRKSTFFKVLYGDEFFTDSVTGTDRDNLLIAHQNWCCELAEFETITNKKASGELKAFLSKSVDTFREPYARSSRMVKRQCVMVGSVNETEFLVDTTGNRRFWIIPVNTQIDTDKVIKFRDAIWSQAKKAFLDGEFWYLDEKYQKESEALNKEYLYQSTWDCIELDNYLQGFEEIGVSGKDILTTVLGFELKDINSSHERKLGHILRKKGWVNKPKKQNGKTLRLWFCESVDNLINKSLNLSDPSDPFPEPIYTNGYSRDRIKDQINKCFLSDPSKKGSDQIKDQTDKLSDPTSNPCISTKDRMDQMDQIQTSPLENLDNCANIDLNQDDSEKNQDNLNQHKLMDIEIDFMELIRLINDCLIELGLGTKEEKRNYVNQLLGINAKSIMELSDDQLLSLYSHFNQ